MTQVRARMGVRRARIRWCTGSARMRSLHKGRLCGNEDRYRVVVKEESLWDT